MTRREELEEKVNKEFMCESFGYSVGRKDVLELLIEVERECWGEILDFIDTRVRNKILSMKHWTPDRQAMESLRISECQELEDWCRAQKEGV